MCIWRVITEVKILDDNFKEVEIGEEGTIYFSAPSKGRFEYYKAEEKTSGAYWGDYFTMGDIGFCDKDGYHFLTGRSADTIISGGTNIYPQEIDNVLLMHDQVADSLHVLHCHQGTPARCSHRPDTQNRSPVSRTLLSMCPQWYRSGPHLLPPRRL